MFKLIIDAAKEQAKSEKVRAVQIAVNSYAEPWSQSGFRASFFKRLMELREAKAVQPGCTLQGLRHTIATMARDGQESDFRIAAAIGDRSTALAAVRGCAHSKFYFDGGFRVAAD